MKINYETELKNWIEQASANSINIESKAFIGSRGYRHLDSTIPLSSLTSDKPSPLKKTLLDPKLLQKHSFLPFIRKDKKVRRFTKKHKVLKGESKRTTEIEKFSKNRPIMYASHIDACIYAFYSFILKSRYESALADTELSKSIIAYRKIPKKNGLNGNKSNIDFARDIHKSINHMDNAAVLCVDIKGFFNNMTHHNIRRAWVEILGEEKLPVGHEAVFRNITKYRYIFLDELLEKLGYGLIHKGRFKYARKAVRTGKISTIKQYNKHINRTNYVHVNKFAKGIPQGSPISDILANLYLLDFDRKLFSYIKEMDSSSVYKRYSDDILIIINNRHIHKVYDYIKLLLGHESIKLRLKTSKTELFFTDARSGSIIDKTRTIEKDYLKEKKTIQYLGFEFDLNDIHIRPGTVSNFYRKVINSTRKKRRMTKRKNSSAAESKPNTSKRNRFSYINQADKKLKSKRLSKQKRNLKKRTKQLIEKHSKSPQKARAKVQLQHKNNA